MTSKEQSKTSGARFDVGSQLQPVLFWICVSLLALVPLIFTTAVYRAFTLPKFLVLLVGSTLVLLMLALIAASDASRKALETLKSKQVGLISIHFIAVSVATFVGVAPLASLFGSYPNEMGLITRLCFFLCFMGLIVAVGYSTRSLFIIVWVIALVGLLVAAYAFAQFFGRDPFLTSSSYTFKTPGGPVVRIPSTLGHANYLGNFLLYATPVAAALAVASRGRARRIALVAVGLSIAAIIFSGTRGAWLGLMAGAITFAVFEIRGGGERSEKASRAIKHKRLRAAIAVVIVLVSALVIISSPASRNVGARARSLVVDRFTGSGRTLLWRDAIRMVPDFSLIGCGPEGFLKAFLAYKSKELASHVHQVNNESSHNSYLDAAISFGLPGAITYGAMIASAFLLLLKSRRRAADRRMKSIIAGLVSSLAAVIVHNFFIYDQIPTGLYFFAFMALAVIASNVTDAGKAAEGNNRTSEQRSSLAIRRTARAAAVAAAAIVAAAVWFSMSLAQGDAATRQAFVSASTRDFDGLVANGEHAARNPEPTGAYSFLFARALALYADAIPRDTAASRSLSPGGVDLRALRSRAIEMATVHAQKSISHTLTPESNYVLLAYLALIGGNTERLREFATEAVRWDPNYFNARWLMAEALLAQGDRDGAAREARLALQLRPGVVEALSVLKRARGEAGLVSPKVQGLVERARLHVEKGSMPKARELLARAIRQSNGPCAACHRELAVVYEKENRYQEAITEWEAFARESADSSAVEQASARIQALKRK